jgi:hypothetical protein
MRLSRGRNTIVTMLAVCALIIVLVWSFLQGRKEMATEQEGERPISAPSRVSISQGETIIHLDDATQKINGILTKALEPASIGQKPLPNQAPHGEERIPGVVVPDSAVVWLQGRAWVYVREGPDYFVRREVFFKQRMVEGWVVTKNFSAGDLVVVEGAQLLLSEEFRSQIRISD